MTAPINQEHEDVLNFAHSLPSGLTKEQIYVRIHERAKFIARVKAAVPAGLTNATITGGDVDGNRVFVNMDEPPSTHLWTTGKRCYIAPSAPAAAPAPESQPAAPIYQVARAKHGGGWVDSTKDMYDETATWNRRIVYAVPVPAAQEGWLPWPGGEWGGDPDLVVEVRPRVAMQGRTAKASQFICWKHRGCMDDIIAYRVAPAMEAQSHE